MYAPEYSRATGRARPDDQAPYPGAAFQRCVPVSHFFFGSLLALVLGRFPDRRECRGRVGETQPILGQAGDSVEPASGPVMRLCRLLLRPLGYLAFVAALATLSAAARLLGDEHELGFFSGRLARMLWRYPEVIKRGVQTAWLAWILLLAWALSPLDPLASRWDEVALVAVAAAVLWRRLVGGWRADR